MIDFDDAVAALRRLHVDGEDLTAVGHAYGQPTARMTAELTAFLAELRRSVEAATRSENRTYSIGAHGRLDEYVDLPPGFRLVPRSEL
ncbi:hypothetical protein [Methylobacterium sp. AMS5]|uniref:hypothetical protein n=1 Tax=Methylobacterium sp. AMS5 TaxID=925818 RepID=UPI00074F86BB|nr:hypothetical protein [Methylobacterium sp. AMS5]AMB46902.1 hypothetical protein Y590_18355 [Methylobacterium sp. AMS5]